MDKPLLSSKILVVDDETAVCSALKEFLEEENYTVATANDGEAALAKMDDFNPHCILLDIRMPLLNGIDALKMIKFRAPETEVIMVTAVANIKIAEECLRSGAFGFVTKPVDLDHLLREIKAALERRKDLLEKKKVAGDVGQLIEEKKNFESMVKTLNADLINALKFPIALMEFQHPEFGCHAKNTAWLAKAIAEQLKLQQVRLSELAGLFHDIGKLCLPFEIMENPKGRYNTVEKMFFQKFPVYGADMIQSNFHLRGLALIIRHQCENVDGSGFPNGIKGHEIPLESKIVAVANAFDEAMRHIGLRNMEQDLAEGEAALAKCQELSGTALDPAPLAALAQVIKNHRFKAAKETKVDIADLQSKMILSRDVFTGGGKLVFPRDTTLNLTRIGKLMDMHRIDPISGAISVYVDSTLNGQA